MSAYYNSHILIYSCCVAFPWFRLPSFDSNVIVNNCILNILRYIFSNWFLDNLPNFGIKRRQSLFVILIDIEYLLVSQWFFEIIIELNITNTTHFCFNLLECLLVLLQEQLEREMILFLRYGSRETIWFMDPIVVPLSFRCELDLVEIIEPVMHSLEKTWLLMACGRAMIAIRHLFK